MDETNIIKTDDSVKSTEPKKEPTLSEIFEFMKNQSTEMSNIKSEILSLKIVKTDIKTEITDNDTTKVENKVVFDETQLTEKIKRELFFDSLNDNQKKMIEENPDLANLSVNSLKNIFKSQANDNKVVNTQNTENDKKKVSGVEIVENKVVGNDLSDDVFEMKKKVDEQNGIKDANFFRTKIIR